MLNNLLKLERPLIIFDLETTGTNTDTDLIIEIAYERYASDGNVAKWRSLINPGIPIPPDSIEIHHITDLHMLACQRCGLSAGEHPVQLDHITCEAFRLIPRFEQIAQRIAQGFSNCDFGGKHIRFDLAVMAARMAALSIPWSYKDAKIIDVDRLEAILEPRDLSSLYKRRIGKDPVDAHRADNDVRMTIELLEEQLIRTDMLPLNLAELHELQWAGWVDTEGKLKRGKDGIVRITFGKHRNTDVRRVPRSYWQWVPKSDMSREFKEYATQMAGGVFP